MIIFLVILVAAFFLSIYCMKIFKQQIPVEASKEFHLLCDNLDDYLLRSEENIPNLKKDLKMQLSFIQQLMTLESIQNHWF